MLIKNTFSFIENSVISYLGSKFFIRFLPLLLVLSTLRVQVDAQSLNPVSKEDVSFTSEGVVLVGTIYKPKYSSAAVVVVHGSGQEPRMNGFAEILSKEGITVLTYDKRGVGKSGGIYAGPEVGTNNIDSVNINLLAKDASAAVNILKQHYKNMPIGILGFSQAGWIIPIAANQNPLVKFMVMFSCPTITTLEQLRFQFYTAGRPDFWDNHTESDVRQHIKNDPDKYQFTSTDPKVSLGTLSIPGLWLFGGKDIQIPVKMCIDQINVLKAQGKSFEYTFFPALGHSTAFANDKTPVDISIQWIKQKAMGFKKNSGKK